MDTQKYAVIINSNPSSDILNVATKYEEAQRLCSQRRLAHRFWTEAIVITISDDDYRRNAL